MSAMDFAFQKCDCIVCCVGAGVEKRDTIVTKMLVEKTKVRTLREVDVMGNKSLQAMWGLDEI